MHALTLHHRRTVNSREARQQSLQNGICLVGSDPQHCRRPCARTPRTGAASWRPATSRPRT